MVRNNPTAHVRPIGVSAVSSGPVRRKGAMSRKPLLGSTDISEGFLVLSCSSVCSHAATKCCTSRVARCSAATWDLWSSRGLLPRRRRFSGSRPTEHRALHRIVHDFTSQGSGQRVRRPDNISSVMLTVAFSQSHHVLLFQGSASVGFPCQRGVTSSVGWVLLQFHTVPPA